MSASAPNRWDRGYARRALDVTNRGARRRRRNARSVVSRVSSLDATLHHEWLPGAGGRSGPELLARRADPFDGGRAPPAVLASGEEHPHGVTP